MPCHPPWSASCDAESGSINERSGIRECYRSRVRNGPDPPPPLTVDNGKLLCGYLRRPEVLLVPRPQPDEQACVTVSGELDDLRHHVARRSWLPTECPDWFADGVAFSISGDQQIGRLGCPARYPRLPDPGHDLGDVLHELVVGNRVDAARKELPCTFLFAEYQERADPA